MANIPKHGNEAAFPQAHHMRLPDSQRDDVLLPAQWGLTKREYFAAMAMQGLLANAGGPIQKNGSTGWGLTNVTWDQVAGVARRAADALLADLEATTVG